MIGFFTINFSLPGYAVVLILAVQVAFLFNKKNRISRWTSSLSVISRSPSKCKKFPKKFNTPSVKNLQKDVILRFQEVVENKFKLYQTNSSYLFLERMFENGAYTDLLDLRKSLEQPAQSLQEALVYVFETSGSYEKVPSHPHEVDQDSLWVSYNQSSENCECPECLVKIYVPDVLASIGPWFSSALSRCDDLLDSIDTWVDSKNAYEEVCKHLHSKSSYRADKESSDTIVISASQFTKPEEVYKKASPAAKVVYKNALVTGQLRTFLDSSSKDGTSRFGDYTHLIVATRAIVDVFFVSNGGWMVRSYDWAHADGLDMNLFKELWKRNAGALTVEKVASASKALVRGERTKHA